MPPQSKRLVRKLPPTETDADRALWEKMATEMSAVEIAAQFSRPGEPVTRQAVYKALRRAGIPARAKAKVDNLNRYLPPNVEWQHAGDDLYYMLMEYGRFCEGLPVSNAPGLRAWMNFMDDARFQDGTPIGAAVVVYDPASDEGFFIEPARPGDAHYLRQEPS